MTDNEFLLVCAFRYCKNRKSYAVGWIERILEKRWNKLPNNVKDIISEDMLESRNDWNKFLEKEKSNEKRTSR